MEKVIQTPSMSFGEALKTCFKKYANFSGRARRSEFWWFSVLGWILSACSYALVTWKFTKVAAMEEQVREVMFDEEKLNALQAQASNFDTIFFLLLALLGIVGLLLLLPSLAVAVRRLHDIGKSGWILLLMLIPIVNFVVAIVLLIYYLKDSDRGVNKFGPSPKYVVEQIPEPAPSYEPPRVEPEPEPVAPVAEEPAPEPGEEPLYNSDNKLSI